MKMIGKTATCMSTIRKIAKFREWLNNSLNEGMPDGIVALNFNLIEPAGISDVKFGIELIGSEAFDENDSDWACEENWEPTQRQINIPLSFSSDDWEKCQKIITDLILEYLQTDFQALEVKGKIIAIGVGFVDGDLEIIYRK